MIKFILRCGVSNLLEYRRRYIPDPNKMMRFPFDSSRKRMSTLIDVKDE